MNGSPIARWSPAIALVVAACLAAGAAGDERPGAEPTKVGFTDVTAASGVAAVVAAHYRNVPKWWLSGMTLVDLDADGDLDLHLAGHGCPAAVALNDGMGGFTCVDPKLSLKRGVRHGGDIPYPGGEIRLSYDFDEDGRIDLLTSWHDGGGVMYLNDSRRAGGRTQLNFRRSRHLDVFCRGCAVADIDRDGRADFLSDAGRKIAVRFGKGDGTFRAAAGSIGGSFEQSGFIPADVNGDGHVDFLAHGCVGGNFYSDTPFERRILLSDGRGRWSDSTAQSGLDRRGGSIHGVGDLNHDGRADLICVEGREIAVYLNDGRGHFRPKAGAVRGLDKIRNKPQVLAWGGAAVTDFDNDGAADILIVGKYYLYVLRGTGGGSFTYANDRWGLPNRAWSAVDEGLCFGDVNSDGMLDLITCGRGPDGKSKGVMVFRNDLPKRNWLRIRPIGRNGSRSAAGAEIRIHSPEAPGKPARLLGYEQVAIWGRQSFHSYYTAAQTERHFGLGDRRAVDVTVEFHPSGKLVTRRNVKANTTVTIPEPP